MTREFKYLHESAWKGIQKGKGHGALKYCSYQKKKNKKPQTQPQVTASRKQVEAEIYFRGILCMPLLHN